MTLVRRAVPLGSIASLAVMVAAAGAAGPSSIGSTTTRTLLRGELALPAADSFRAPGFHQVLVAGGRIPRHFDSTKRFKLTLVLRDVSRPGQTCSSDHPLSGCATVDWADDPSRPNVPAGGVFTNRITLRLASGTRSFYLRQSGALAGTSDRYVPG